MTTFEDAKKCPKCGQPGEDIGFKPGRSERGGAVKVHTIMCRTQLCPWFNTGYLVQVNEDGSIPAAYSGTSGGLKKFPKISQETASKIEDNILRQLQAETQTGGGEIRNPNA